MRTTRLSRILAAVSGVTTLHAAGPLPGTEFDATLIDGSRIIGTVEGAALPVKTQFGDQGIRFEVLRRIVNHAGKTPAAALVAGKRQDKSVVLDGKDDHVILENHPAIEELDELTVSIWTNLNSFRPGGYANEHGYLANKGNDMWWNPSWCLGYSKASDAGRGAQAGPLPALFTIGSETRGSRATCRVVSKTKLATGQWYHLVGTCDGKRARIYVNGRMEGEKDYIGMIRRDGAPLLLGGGKLGGTEFGNHFTTDAPIDNFRLYRRALSAAEVRLLTNLEAREQ